MIDDQDERIKYTKELGQLDQPGRKLRRFSEILRRPDRNRDSGTYILRNGYREYSPVHKTTEVKLKSLSTEVWATADTYSATQKTGKIFSTEEHKDKTLEYGIHTVKSSGDGREKCILQAEIK